MKNLVLLLFVLMVSGTQRLFAYDTFTIDTARVSIYYRFEYETDTISHLKKNDVLALQIGQNYTAFFSPYTLEFYTTKKPVSYKGKVAADLPASTVVNYYLYSNLKTKMIEHLESIAYRYWTFTEKQPPFDWKILPDTMHVAGYLCQKAECDYSGRHWIAWFSPDIPLNYGPYKFSGLPGLIMKIEDSSRHYCFEAAYIDEEPAPMLRMDVKTQSVSKQHLFQEKHKYLKNRFKYTDMVWGVDNSHLGTPKDSHIDPLERDAEFIKE